MSYHLIQPTVPRVPVLLSIPHCGTAFPSEIQDQYRPQALADLDDTDWYVDRLYDFAAGMGITMITAKYHRWVIDLNRQPDSMPLYTDGRVITDLVPTTDFLGNPIYQNHLPDYAEIQRRIEQYFMPYHLQIEATLTDLQAQFGAVLLYDAHSIRQSVPTIRKERFPDIILGDNNGLAAHASLIRVALENLTTGKYQVNHNDPFKGGYITRHFGNPAQNRHALQLERTKVHYLDDTEREYDKTRADEMRLTLKKTLEALTQAVVELGN